MHHTFATAGSDGAFNFWDKDSKQRLKVYPSLLLVWNNLLFSDLVWIPEFMPSIVSLGLVKAVQCCFCFLTPNHMVILLECQFPHVFEIFIQLLNFEVASYFLYLFRILFIWTICTYFHEIKYSYFIEPMAIPLSAWKPSILVSISLLGIGQSSLTKYSFFKWKVNFVCTKIAIGMLFPRSSIHLTIWISGHVKMRSTYTLQYF